MHSQTAHVISMIRQARSRNKYIVNLTASQYSPMGKILGHMYYQTDMVEMARRSVEVVGYPHNGGEHSCLLMGEKHDIAAFLEILQEQIESKQGRFEDEVVQVADDFKRVIEALMLK